MTQLTYRGFLCYLDKSFARIYLRNYKLFEISTILVLPTVCSAVTNNHYFHINLTTNDGLWNPELLSFIRGRKHNEILKSFSQCSRNFHRRQNELLICYAIYMLVLPQTIFMCLITIARLQFTTIVIKHDTGAARAEILGFIQDFCT